MRVDPVDAAVVRGAMRAADRSRLHGAHEAVDAVLADQADVRLVGLASAEHIAPIALAHAQAAGVDLRIDGSGSTTHLVFAAS